MLSSHVIPTTQRGAVLIVALIFLLLLTLIGTAAMRTTTLQERMAGNTRDLNLSFQAAEAALRAGENWLEIAANATSAQSNPPWDGAAVTGTLAGLDAQLADAPTFYVGQPTSVRMGIGLGGPPKFLNYYPVNARGSGGSATAQTVLETYVWPTNE
ncbi:MAG: pilus assembly protein PilX [Gammaproteobacteria bacterium HGW-Gammaproteobacteria-1]|jgi:type IV pilus assembly protein PilX|nr:MAG: pilus assembly protein PilX [Gammaproteobacteria bacterium HGW-Gammaproteobacteria-1]